MLDLIQLVSMVLLFQCVGNEAMRECSAAVGWSLFVCLSGAAIVWWVCACAHACMYVCDPAYICM